MERSLKTESIFKIQLTERLEAAQHRAKLTSLSKTAEINSLPYSGNQRYREFILDAKDKGKVKVKESFCTRGLEKPQNHIGYVTLEFSLALEQRWS